MNAEKISKILELKDENDFSYSRIARELGISRSSVYKYYTKYRNI